MESSGGRKARPDWRGLSVLANGQAGYFTTAQAAIHGVSIQLLSRDVLAGWLERAGRGIYRFSYYPSGEHEDHVVAWLWSREDAVVSHESALQIHDLSDALPARIHLTLPTSRRADRGTIPPLYVVHFADLDAKERVWVGPVPVTTPTRTVLDVSEAHGDSGLIQQAVEQGVSRRLFQIWDVVPAIVYASGHR